MTYTTIQGDMWDLISHKVYGDTRFTDVLIAANPRCNKILVFSAGIVLDVPEVDERVSSDRLPPWKQVQG
ncbi:MAG: tail protein X [Oscillospiraceae bacterium]|nr:tail protein X [Oscillospiraceae bacterium]